MSKYSSIDTDFDDEECLVEALVQDGFKPVMAKDQIKGDCLEGFQGDKRKEHAHIILPRKQVGGAANDIGFVRQPDGKFTATISAYDQGRHGTKWLDKIRQNFVVAKQTREWKKQGYTEFETTKNDDGGVTVKAKIPTQHVPAQQQKAQVGFRR
jgi:hypothetical protein